MEGGVPGAHPKCKTCSQSLPCDRILIICFFMPRQEGKKRGGGGGVGAGREQRFSYVSASSRSSYYHPTRRCR